MVHLAQKEIQKWWTLKTVSERKRRRERIKSLMKFGGGLHALWFF